MAKCLFCERRSLFLRVNSEGYCKDCVPRVAARRMDAEEKKRKEEEARAEKLRREEEQRRREEELRRSFDEHGNYIEDYFTRMVVTVAGVTFKNGRRSRQTILRNIYWKDDPYQKVDFNKCIDLVLSSFEGEPAVEVWVYNKKSREQIGYIPKRDALFVVENFYRLYSCTEFNVYGGSLSPDGERKNFGCDFCIKFCNKPGQGKVDDKLFESLMFLSKLKSLSPRENAHAIAYNAFVKRFPHAQLYACCPMQDDENGLIMYVQDFSPLYVWYNPDSGLVRLEYSDGFREPEIIN